MAAADSEDATTEAEDEYLTEIRHVAPEIDDTTCGICNAEFLDSEDLNLHVNQVHKEFVQNSKASKVCQLCDAAYEDLDAYARHVCDEHLMQLLCCRICTKCFTEGSQYKRHERKHRHTNNTFACTQCMAVFSTSKEVKAHESVHHDNSSDGIILTCLPHLSALLKQNAITYLQSDDRTLTCASCQYTAESIDSFLEHSTEKCDIFVCENCCFVTHGKRNLIKHLCRKFKCVVEESETTQCLTCKDYVHCRRMQMHIMSCQKYKCYICNIQFTTIESLSAHQTIVHPAELDVIKCKFCVREFVGQLSLDKHMKRSHSHQYILYKYKCTTCEQIFKHPQLLFAHYFTKHKDLEPYTCKICNKKFRVRKSFTIHIKMVHKSIGVVEFDDQYHVFFAEKKSENPFIPKCVIPEMVSAEGPTPSIKIKTQKEINNEARKNNDEDYHPTETEADEDIEKNPKRKPKVNKRKKIEAIELSSSEDEEVRPLSMLKKRAERKRFQKQFPCRTKNYKVIAHKHKQLTCKVCNKYCYTYQNYQNHIQLHNKANVKCIKCSKTFKSKNGLSEHLMKDHAKSRLTETLRHMLERKQVNRNFNNDNHNNRNNEDLTPSERFMRTIKKFKPERQTTSATISPASGDVSVRKFIENFVPDISDPANTAEIQKYNEEEPVVTIKQYDSPFYRKNMIKMTKFIPEPPLTSFKLKMPEKFKAPPAEKVKLKVILVHQIPKLSIFEQEQMESNFPIEYDDEASHDNEAPQDDDFAVNDDMEDRNEVIIPDVAEEVMLEGTEDHSTIKIQTPQKIVIPKLPEGYPKIHIATLQQQAPFYKIITVKNTNNSNEAIVIDTDQIKQEKQAKEPIKKKDVISLPDGSKFVSANPLAHLLGGKPVEELLENTKNKYYKPARNFQGMFAEALQNLEYPIQKAKKQRKIPDNDEPVESNTRKSDTEQAGKYKRKKPEPKTTSGKKVKPGSDIRSESPPIEKADWSIEETAVEPGKSLPIL